MVHVSRHAHALVFCLLFTVAGLSSTSVFALVDAQLLYGPRFTHAESDGKSQYIPGTDLKLAAHVDPIPLIPVAAGLYLRSDNWGVKDSFSVLGFNDFKGTQLGVEAYAWLPIDLFDLTPYAKVGYTFYGDYEGKLKEASLGQDVTHVVDYNVTGSNVTAGVRWVPVALVGFLLEAEYDQEQFKADTYKVGGAKQDKTSIKSVATEALIVRLGVDVKI